VVALIACTGPAGPAGPAATAVPGTQGPAGTAAPPGLQALALKTLIFDVAATEIVMMMLNLEDLNGADDEDTDAIEGAGTPMAFSGAVGTLTYRIQSAVNVPDTGVTYDLDGSILTVVVASEVTAQANDIVIMIEGTDDANNADDVAHVNVRLNEAADTDGPAGLTLVVGTQPVASGTGEDPDYWDQSDAADNIVCGMLNECLVKLMVVDTNLQDIHELDWYPKDSDAFSVAANADNTGVIVTGNEALTTAVTLYVWAVDEGGLPEPEMDEANDQTPERDESVVPADGESLYSFMITVDEAPSMSDRSIESLTMDVGANEVVGTVFDPEDTVIAILYTMDDDHDSQIATVGWTVTDPVDTTTNDGRKLSVTAHNSGSTTFDLKLSEPTVENQNNPDQYVVHPFTVNVRQETPTS
jgi:hypothetical protein